MLYITITQLVETYNIVIQFCSKQSKVKYLLCL